MTMNVTALATEIINGRRLSENDDLGTLKRRLLRSLVKGRTG